MMFLRNLVHLVQKIRLNFSRNWRNPTLPRLGVYAACLCEFAWIAELKMTIKGSGVEEKIQLSPKESKGCYHDLLCMHFF